MVTRNKINQPLIHKEPLNFQWSTMDPFLFCVHHLDNYPTSDGNFGPNASLVGRDIGHDFSIKDGWRMYHGKKIPGFPAHPHRGFETVTVVQKGFVDHADSMGASGRYANGDLQWMTAGSGVQHSEMFPLLDINKSTEGEIDNTVELFQIWLNLPSKNKFVEPYFTMHWNEKIPHLTIQDNNEKLTTIQLYAGDYLGTRSLSPPPYSWARDPENHVWIWVLELEPESQFMIPATEVGINRNLYYYSGSGAQLIDGEVLSPMHRHQLVSDSDIKIQSGNLPSKFLLLQGRPIGEPVAQYGPFVMNTMQEIQKAFEDYRNTEFGGWSWSHTDVVHGREERFARYANGRVDKPG